MKGWAKCCDIRHTNLITALVQNLLALNLVYITFTHHVLVISIFYPLENIILIGRRRTRQRKIGNSMSRTELPNLSDHEAVQR